jgi:antitoxin ParD1/3/4
MGWGRGNAELAGETRAAVRPCFYGNATEVIRDAIRRMQAEDSRVAAWHTAIQKGDDQFDRGEGVDYTPGVLEEITHSATQAMHSGQPMDPDVLP